MANPILIETIDGMREELATRGMRSLGFVPTMGALHDGHASLIERADYQCDLVVVSVFVNVLQFAPGEDFHSYPRDLAGDFARSRQAGADIVFAPSADELLHSRPGVTVCAGELGERLCGQGRPGHFDGVATIVAKFLNIVGPQRAYFGEKDWQQLQIIKKLAIDLDFDTRIVGVATVRDPDGLAISSRNQYLSPHERRSALALPRALESARALVENGESDPAVIGAHFGKLIAGESEVELEYFSLCTPEDLIPVERVTGDVLLAAAVRIGGTRLIDNVVMTRS